MGRQEEIGRIRLSPSGSVPPEGGAPLVNLCDARQPFNNLWIPVSAPDPITGKLVPKNTGEVHLMTRWVPNVSLKVIPKTVRACLMQELKPKLASNMLREPLYDTQER